MSEIEILHAARTHVGRVRTQNEDAFLAVPEARLFAVADGLGGHAAGEVASRIAVRTLSERLGDGRRDGLPGEPAIKGAIEEANTAIRRAAARDHELSGMGTTVTALLLAADGTWLIAHVGDSRAYLLRDGKLRRLTRDHTYVQEMVERGRLTDEQARLHPRSSMLTRALGIEERVDVALYEGRGRRGDRFLLATDGLTGLISEAELAERLAGDETPAEVVEGLVSAANAAGGTDNITAVVVDLDDG